jgi:hypothetical protein
LVKEHVSFLGKHALKTGTIDLLQELNARLKKHQYLQTDESFMQNHVEFGALIKE